MSATTSQDIPTHTSSTLACVLIPTCVAIANSVPSLEDAGKELLTLNKVLSPPPSPPSPPSPTYYILSYTQPAMTLTARIAHTLSTLPFEFQTLCPSYLISGKCSHGAYCALKKSCFRTRSGRFECGAGDYSSRTGGLCERVHVRQPCFEDFRMCAWDVAHIWTKLHRRDQNWWAVERLTRLGEAHFEGTYGVCETSHE